MVTFSIMQCVACSIACAGGEELKYLQRGHFSGNPPMLDIETGKCGRSK
ncbi:hypothetical protein MMEU_0455 [Mycobacterium marinum str. Europe]|nr:hypothetical protein MMEU_0455 [Mycobacterium marinum str. Europe]